MRGWLSSMLRSPKGADERTEFTDEELTLGIDHETTVFVAELAQLPMTWIEFPVEIVLQEQRLNVAVVAEAAEQRQGRSPVPLVLTARQVRHAELMLERVEGLRKLRLQLCPRVIDEDLFWAVYFLLTKQHLRSSKLDQEVRLSEGDIEVPALQQSGATIKAGKRDWAEVLKEENSRLIYKCICEQGLPRPLRRQVFERLLVMSGGVPLEPAQQTYQRLFPGPLPPPLSVVAVPSFGCAAGDIPRDRRCRRVLAALALQHGHVYAPQLPVVLGVLAQDFEDEALLLDMASRLVQHSLETPVGSPAALSTILFVTRGVHLAFACAVLARLIELNFPRLHSRMHFLGVHTARFAATWYATLFAGMAPAEDVVSRWLYGGMPALHHLALAVLFANAAVLTQCETEKQFLLALAATQKRVGGPSLLRCANAVRVKQRAWAALIADSEQWWNPAAAAKQCPEPRLAPFSRPPVRERSRAMRNLDEGFVWEQLYEAAIPLRRRAGAAHLVYHSDADGKSLLTLQRKLQPDRLHVLLIRCAARGVVGVLFSHVGVDDGEMVVWSCAAGGEESVVTWHGWTGEPAVRPLLQIGAGLVVTDNAIALDEDLASGISRPSATFGTRQPLLPPSDSFQCDEIELFVLLE